MEKIVFLSSSDFVAETNAARYITKIVTEDKPLKVLSCFERMKDQLNSFCMTNVGMSPFSQQDFQQKTLYPLLSGYKSTMSNLDPNWWRIELEKYIESITESIPDVVRFLFTECSSSEMIDLACERDFLILRAQGTSTAEDSSGYMSLESFRVLSKKCRVESFCIDNDRHHAQQEDINEDQLSKISKIICK